MRVRTHDDLSQWLKFFLSGIIETSKKGVETFNGIFDLKESVDIKLKKLKSREGNARRLMDYLFKRPIINAKTAEEVLSLSGPTVYKLLKDLNDMGVLEIYKGVLRGRVYYFKEYIDLFKG